MYWELTLTEKAISDCFAGENNISKLMDNGKRSPKLIDMA
jgi:hypothetical protein